MKEKIIQKIKDTRMLYLHEEQYAREKMHKEMDMMTAQQIQQETIFIQDMESRAYALFLLLEELEALDDE